MEITEKQLFNYIDCPAKYDIMYNMKIDFPENMTYQKLLSTTSRFFYMNLLNGKVCTYAELKTKWDTLCSKYAFMDVKKTLAGWGLIIQMAKWAEDEQIIIGDVETKYAIPIDGNVIHGNIEAIAVKKNKTIELLSTSFSEKSLDKNEIDMKLKHSLDFLGFKGVYGKYPDGIKVHSVKYAENVYTTRTEPDIDRLRTTVRNVCKGIENEIFYPRENVFCKSCVAIQYCKYWYKQK